MESIKERFIQKQDDRTAQDRLSFMRIQIEQLRLAKDFQQGERTWLDKGGRPLSEDLRVEERSHRVNRDLLELTMTIDDPKMYAHSWVALNRFHEAAAG